MINYNNFNYLYNKNGKTVAVKSNTAEGQKMQGANAASGSGAASGASSVSGSSAAYSSGASSCSGASNSSAASYEWIMLNNVNLSDCITVGEFSVNQVVTLFSDGNLTVPELRQWFKSNGVQGATVKNTNGTYDVQFEYNGKKYNLSCTFENARYQTDDKHTREANVRQENNSDSVNNTSGIGTNSDTKVGSGIWTPYTLKQAKLSSEEIKKYFETANANSNYLKFNAQAIKADFQGKTINTPDQLKAAIEEKEETEKSSQASNVFDFNNKENINFIVENLKDSIPNINAEKVKAMVKDLTSMANTKGVDPTDYVSARLVDFLTMRAEKPNMSLEEMNEQLAFDNITDVFFDNISSVYDEVCGVYPDSIDALLELQDLTMFFYDEEPIGRNAYLNYREIAYMQCAKNGNLTNQKYYNNIVSDLLQVFPQQINMTNEELKELDAKIHKLSPEQILEFVYKTLDLPSIDNPNYQSEYDAYISKFNNAVNNSIFSGINNPADKVDINAVYKNITGVEFNPDKIIDTFSQINEAKSIFDITNIQRTIENIEQKVENSNLSIGDALWQMAYLSTGSAEDSDIIDFIKTVTGNENVKVENNSILFGEEETVAYSRSLGNQKRVSSIPQDEAAYIKAAQYYNDTYQAQTGCANTSEGDNKVANILSNPDFYHTIGNRCNIAAGITLVGGSVLAAGQIATGFGIASGATTFGITVAASTVLAQGAVIANSIGDTLDYCQGRISGTEYAGKMIVNAGEFALTTAKVGGLVAKLAWKGIKWTGSALAPVMKPLLNKVIDSVAPYSFSTKAINYVTEQTTKFSATTCDKLRNVKARIIQKRIETGKGDCLTNDVKESGLLDNKDNLPKLTKKKLYERMAQEENDPLTVQGMESHYKNGENLRVAQYLKDDLKALREGKNSTVKIFSANASKADVLTKTPVGEVAQIGEQLYINNNGTLETVNLTKEMYDKLFPPVNRFLVNQGKSESCYFLSTIARKYIEPETRAEILKLFTQVGDDVYVKFPNSNFSYKFTGGNITDLKALGNKNWDHLSNSSLWTNMLEHAGSFTANEFGNFERYLVEDNFKIWSKADRMKLDLKDLDIVNIKEDGNIILDVNKYVEKFSDYLVGLDVNFQGGIIKGTEWTESLLTGVKAEVKETSSVLNTIENLPKGSNISMGIIFNGRHAAVATRVGNGGVYFTDPLGTALENFMPMEKFRQLITHVSNPRIRTVAASLLAGGIFTATSANAQTPQQHLQPKEPTQPSTPPSNPNNQTPQEKPAGQDKTSNPPTPPGDDKGANNDGNNGVNGGQNNNGNQNSSLPNNSETPKNTTVPPNNQTSGNITQEGGQQANQSTQTSGNNVNNPEMGSEFHYDRTESIPWGNSNNPENYNKITPTDDDINRVVNDYIKSLQESIAKKYPESTAQISVDAQYDSVTGKIKISTHVDINANSSSFSSGQTNSTGGYSGPSIIQLMDELDNKIKEALTNPATMIASTNGAGSDGGFMSELMSIKLDVESGAYTDENGIFDYVAYYSDLALAGAIDNMGVTQFKNDEGDSYVVITYYNSDGTKVTKSFAVQGPKKQQELSEATIQTFLKEITQKISLIGEGLSIDECNISKNMQDIADQITQKAMLEFANKYIEKYLDKGMNLLSAIHELTGSNSQIGGNFEDTYFMVGDMNVSSYILNKTEEDINSGLYNNFQILLRTSDRISYLNKIQNKELNVEDLETVYDNLQNETYLNPYAWAAIDFGLPSSEARDLGNQESIVSTSKNEAKYTGYAYVTRTVSEQEAIEIEISKAKHQMTYELAKAGYVVSSPILTDNYGYAYIQIKNSKTDKSFRYYFEDSGSKLYYKGISYDNEEYRQFMQQDFTSFNQYINRLNYKDMKEKNIQAAQLNVYKNTAMMALGLIEPEELQQAINRYNDLVNNYSSTNNPKHVYYVYNDGRVSDSQYDKYYIRDGISEGGPTNLFL